MSGCKMSPVALGLSFGVLWGVSLFVMGLLAYFGTYGKPFVDAVATLYFGYEPSIKGSIIGGIIGLVDGFISGFLIAWLYNVFNCCKCVCCDKKEIKP